jgi:hypothetical protein
MLPPPRLLLMPLEFPLSWLLHFHPLLTPPLLNRPLPLLLAFCHFQLGKIIDQNIDKPNEDQDLN